MGTNIIVTAIVVVYLLFMLWIGWYSSTKITSNTDFMVAGRRLGPLLMAGTLAATEIGGGSCDRGSGSYCLFHYGRLVECYTD